NKFGSETTDAEISLDLLPGGHTETLCQFRLREQSQNCVGQLLRVLWRHQQTVNFIVDNFEGSPGGGCDYRKARGHHLQKSIWQRFCFRGQHPQIATCQQLRNVGPPAKKQEISLERQAVHLLFQSRTLRPIANHEKYGIRSTPANLVRC